MSLASIPGVAGNVVYNALLPEDNTERLTFRRFKGDALALLAAKGTPLTKNDVLVVVLKINPSEIRYDQPKITQKVQTNSPGRFVVYDWGTDLKVLSVSGSTGNMMPEVMSKGWNPLQGLTETANSYAKGSGQSIAPKDWNQSAAQNIVAETMRRTIPHYDLLRLSPKFRAFERLQQLYETFDADRDVLTMEMGDIVYRVYFTGFSFTEEANNLYSWKYNFSVNVLTDLTQAVRRGDVTFPSTTLIDRSK